MARGRTSPKGVAEKQEFATRMTPASGQNASVRGVPTGWLAPTKVERGSLAVPIEVAAKVVSALVAPFIWLFSYFHDMIMFKIIDNEFIYNVSWEDPRIDQHLFKLTRDDHVLTIASAGDNALDYVIDGARVTAVDLNLCQIALSELKVAAIKSLPYDEFWRIFAESDIALLKARYPSHLRPLLCRTSQTFWDGYQHKIRNFMYAGTSGWAAYWLFRWIFPAFGLGFIRTHIMEKGSKEEFAALLEKHRGRIALLTWFLDHVCIEAASVLAGVPSSQLALGKHRKDNFAIIFANVFCAEHSDLVRDNYFFHGYLAGKYSKDCCPRYLREEHFEALRANLDEGRLELFNGTLEDRVAQCGGGGGGGESGSEGTGSDDDEAASNPASKPFTVASLLDHMDWMPPRMVQNEISALMKHMDPVKGRVYWRSWSENVHSAPLMWLAPRRVADMNPGEEDRVCMYFSTWVAYLKDTPYLLAPRVDNWDAAALAEGGASEDTIKSTAANGSLVEMVTTGAKIVTFPVWKHFTKVNGEGHQKQMELFYQCQKRSYDSFRDSLLHARPTLIEYLPLKSEGGAVWVDIGGGTARNLEYLNPKTIRRHFKRIYIVDISPSLLSIASERLRKFGLEDLVTLVLHDVTSDSVFEELGLPLASVDVVTMSYSLSMIPDKDRAVENALKLLKPNGEGYLGIADFWMAGNFEHEMGRAKRKARAAEAKAHKWWFAHDHVHLLDDDQICVKGLRNTSLVWDQRFRGGVPFLPMLKPVHGVYIVATL